MSENHVAVLEEKLRKTKNTLMLKDEFIRILKTQVEPSVFLKALELARTNCKPKFRLQRNKSNTIKENK